MKNIHRGRPITIYGDGSATRDFLHAQDLARGIIAALNLQMKNPSEVFHLSSGKEVSIAELANQVILASGNSAQDVPVIFEDRRVGEVERNFADFTKAHNQLGFEPTISLENGLAEMWHWYCQNVF